MLPIASLCVVFRSRPAALFAVRVFLSRARLDISSLYSELPQGITNRRPILVKCSRRSVYMSMIGITLGGLLGRGGSDGPHSELGGLVCVVFTEAVCFCWLLCYAVLRRSGRQSTVSGICIPRRWPQVGSNLGSCRDDAHRASFISGLDQATGRMYHP